MNRKNLIYRNNNHIPLLDIINNQNIRKIYLNKNHNKADNELNKNILITSYNFDNKNINN